MRIGPNLMKEKILKSVQPAKDMFCEINEDFDAYDDFQPDFFLANELIDLALEVVNQSCGCDSCLERECNGWWVKFNLKKAKGNIPK